LFEGAFRLDLVQFHPAAEKMIRVKHPDGHVGVSDRDLLAAAIVANRAGIGAGAIGPDLQRAYRIDPCDGAAAGAHGVNVEHWQTDGSLVDSALGRDHRITLMD